MIKTILLVLSVLIGGTTLALGVLLLAGELSYVNVTYPQDCLDCGTQEENNIPVFLIMTLCALLLLIQTISKGVDKNKF